MHKSDEFEAGEEVADFKGSGFRSVGAVSAIVADAGAEVAANGAGCGFLGIGGTHSVAPLDNGAFAFENHGEDFAGTHEVSKLAEEGARFVDGVETAGLFFSETHRLDGDDFEASFVNSCKNFTLLAPTDPLGLATSQSPSHHHYKFPPKF